MELQKTLVPQPVKYSRIQSPSSINTFKQCPRKYYYQYIQKLPTSTNIHFLRGEIVHSALESFFSFNVPESLDNSYSLKIILLEMFKRKWESKKNELESLGLPEEAIKMYHDESVSMLDYWFSSFNEKLSELSKNKNIAAAFKMLTPKVEQAYVSTKLGVRGFVDAIQEVDNVVTIVDYKTSSKDTITNEYQLQLAIYALLYEERHGKRPDKLAINFLKFGERFLEVKDFLLESAKLAVREVHEKTNSNNIIDYPKNITPRCKWSNGQCDFYEVCFKKD